MVFFCLESTHTADALLRLILQAWLSSTIAFFNWLAYSVRGISSILYGLHLRRRGCTLSWRGMLLAVNGADCILSVIGSLTGNALLGQGVLISDILFLAALFPLAWDYWRSGNS